MCPGIEFNNNFLNQYGVLQIILMKRGKALNNLQLFSCCQDILAFELAKT